MKCKNVNISPTALLLGKLLLLGCFLTLWEIMSWNPQLAFFFGEPCKVLMNLWQWFTQGEGKMDIEWGDRLLFSLSFPAQIYPHLIITLTETLLAFTLGTLAGMLAGLYLGVSPLASALLAPYIKAVNSLPRVILAPIFAMWFGLGIWSKVAFAITLVFFVVFFNVYQGVRDVNPTLLANVRMLGASRRQQLLTVYLPSATSWVFSSLHTAIGLAFVGAVVGEYLGSSRGIGYLILQAEGNFDINTILAGTLLLTLCALLLDVGVNVIERKALRYRQVK
ncbi:ABC transporter permease [Candidatus Fukatsuia symbiotica]|uniref:ABC transporter permease n=2 Tax=Candidatus Fukatsuia symbiotica TaxID=1878942 RepID=A0A2U8I890_9GAMM|nr:ABC transporter permease [Candidatus Fukatsuia symbiotica]AWK15313.1 ABC transporter permease [Candidatus Fukatsuia symbiotica]MEA9445963.1 ABC transporter permease [Candidatus Fukatsuia symbiotica]